MSVLIIGAGHAAGQLVASLRMEGYDGAIRIIGDEAYPPYQRPPLSKQLLSGEMELDQVYLKPEEFYTENQIELTLGRRVDSIDRAAKSVTLDNGETVPYD
ncbi:MAG: FAD-dependent oxidoreductase, partial [Rhodospirillales bacterium]|nr:FAD-dependent oxidoreductase [Rhodospirillales bacterium]